MPQGLPHFKWIARDRAGQSRSCRGLDSGVRSKVYPDFVSHQKIAETAADAGVTPDTLRYYERVGLLGRPDRSPNGYRLYDEETTRRVLFIKGAQRMGLRLREIKELLETRDRGACPCGHTRTLVEQRIGEVESELA